MLAGLLAAVLTDVSYNALKGQTGNVRSVRNTFSRFCLNIPTRCALLMRYMYSENRAIGIYHLMLWLCMSVFPVF